MFDGKVWYHAITRKAIIAFGVMFNNIHVRRKDKNGNITETLRVPLTYAPKNKMESRILRQPDPAVLKTEVILPRMSFEITKFEYDPMRKINLNNQLKTVISQTQAKRVYGPVPYNLTMNLYVYAKNQDDALQIMEQIVPAFNPDFNVTVDYVPELGLKHDLPIILNSIDYNDSYEADLVTHRMIIWTFTFTAKLYYYGPVETQEVIRTAIVSVFKDPDLMAQIDKYSVATDPLTATPSDQYRFIETFDDSLKNIG